MISEIKNVAAHRSLDRTHPDGTVTTVNVSIGDIFVVPASCSHETDMSGAWLEISGAGSSDQHRKIYGDDSMQALYLAMQWVGRMLDEAECASEIEQTGYEGTTQFGFPLWPVKDDEAKN